MKNFIFDNPIGVMQGRLLPKYKGRYQAHPVDLWSDEFYFAKKFNLQLIEFIVDLNELEKNPLMSEAGQIEIRNISNKTGVSVKTICADIFMEIPLHKPRKIELPDPVIVLEKLIHSAISLEVTDIVIPLVDQSSIKSIDEQDMFIRQIQILDELLMKHKVNICLESDFSPREFQKFLAKLDRPYVKVNYDIGNSASLGYSPKEEFSCYGRYITDIHIKDRKLNGGSVPLGTGDADFKEVFRQIMLFGYTGPFIMQAYRDDEGISVFENQLYWIRDFLSTLGKQSIGSKSQSY